MVKHQANITGAKDAQPNIFTTYHIEEDLFNGKVQYTSTNKRYTIAYSEIGRWFVKERY